jgi:hypothetical protein
MRACAGFFVLAQNSPPRHPQTDLFVGNPIIQPSVLGAASIDVAFEE